jgi:hypothetical protein
MGMIWLWIDDHTLKNSLPVQLLPAVDSTLMMLVRLKSRSCFPRDRNIDGGIS